MGTKGRDVPRVVCCAIAISRWTGQIIVITSRTRQDIWVLPKGGVESSDNGFEATTLREASEEAGARGRITRYVTTVYSDATTYHFYEMSVESLDAVWPECKERRREWVDYNEALRRVSWKQELARGLVAWKELTARG